MYNQSPYDIIPTDPVVATLTVISLNSSGYYSNVLVESQEVIIPSYDSNLVYFKVQIPDSSTKLYFNLTVQTSLIESSTDNNSITDSYTVTTISNSQTADTTFESTPSGFTVPSSTATTPTMGQTLDSNASWQIWEWVNGDYKLITYGVDFDLDVSVTADDAVQTETVVGSSTTMKSGYGIQIAVSSILGSYGTTTMPDHSAYTILQSGNVYLPENSYSFAFGQYRTLQLVNGVLMFAENSNTITSSGAVDNRRTHFIPIYYPDGYYTLKVYGYNLWTPAGMINATATVSQIVIDGDIFDDWVITKY